MLGKWAKLAGLLVVACAIAAPERAVAQKKISSKHIHDLAREVERKAKVLHKEVDAHFRATPQYKQLHDSVARMEKLARHIHDTTDVTGDIDEVRADVRRLHRLFHRVEELVDDWADSRRADRKGVRHIRRSLEELRRPLEHLQRDVR